MTTPKDLPSQQLLALQLYCDHPKDEICELMGITMGTLKTHLHRAIGNLGARNTAGAIAIAFRRGLIR